MILHQLFLCVAAAASACAGASAVLDFLGPEEEGGAHASFTAEDGTVITADCCRDYATMRKHYLRYKAGQESIRDYPYLAELVDFFECDGDVPVDVFRELIAEGAEVDAVDRYGRTALQKLVDGLSPRLVELVIRAGADVKRLYPATENESSQTCLHVAAQHHVGEAGAECCRLLVEAGADINAVNDSGETPLDLAAGLWRAGWRAWLPIVFYLVNHGATMKKEPPLPPIYLEMAKGNVEGVKRLLAQHPLSELEADAEAALLLGDAAYLGNAEICAALLAAGANVHTVYHDQQTPLIIAAWEGHLDLCRLFLRAGADGNAEEWLRAAQDIAENYAPEDKRAPLLELIRAAGGRHPGEPKSNE